MSPVPAGQCRRFVARWTATGVATSMTIALLAGCGTASDPGSGRAGSPGSHGADAGRATRAALVLERFAAAQQDGGSPRLSVAPGNLTRQEGDWEVAVGENAKLALLTGHLRAGTPLPSATSQEVLVDGSGREAATTVVSARDVLAAMSQDRTDCHG